jgi:hypothetical protein
MKAQPAQLDQLVDDISWHAHPPVLIDPAPLGNVND